IQTWVEDDKKLIWDRAQNRLRPLGYGDIALLFQSLNSAPYFEEAFQAVGIPYLTIGGRGYFERQEIWDMMNLLAVLYRRSDDLALASVLRSPMFGLSDDTLLLLRLRQRDGKLLSLWEALMTQEIDPDWPPIGNKTDLSILAFAQEVFSRLSQLVGRLTIAELLSVILNETGFEATLLGMRDGELRRANVLKLLSVARRQQHISLSEFTQFVQNMTTFEAREGDAVIEATDVVQLMSVHKSKGLEFPVVILPHCDWRGPGNRAETILIDNIVGPVVRAQSEEFSDDNSLETSSVYKMAKRFYQLRENAERQRLLYVAMTRAQDYLVISGKRLGKSSYSNTLNEVWVSAILKALFNTLDADTIDSYLEHSCAEPLLIPCAGSNVQLQTLVIEEPSVLRRKQAESLQSNPESWLQSEVFPLLASLDIQEPSQRFHVSATDLEHLGRIRINKHDPRAFRQYLLNDMPLPIRALSTKKQRSIKSIVGNVVHRALQMQVDLPLNELRELLKGFAWEEGAINLLDQKLVVDDAVELLRKYQDSKLARMLSATNQIFRELAFTFEYERYVIHGMIDLLFEQEGQWYVVDYKTSRILRDSDYETFSRQYRYQMGAYAAAVETQLGLRQPPIVMLYYLRHSTLYRMPESEWRAALQTLDRDFVSTLIAE
ncbi:MAG: hypothetical protein CUN55_09965, partial [Phototrophicales bacterium]